MAWSLYEWNDVVTDFLGNDEDLIDAFASRADHLRRRGNLCRSPVTECLGEGIFELRVRAGKEQSRFLYFFEYGQRVIFVVAFWKKSQKTPRDKIELAKQKRILVREGNRTNVSYIN
jgi:phage-related protein